jgi:carboxymethylenebutenolidase
MVVSRILNSIVLGAIFMCDETDFRGTSSAIPTSRRDFVEAAGAVGIAALWAGNVNAATQTMLNERDIVVKTADGEADCFFVHPKKGKHPGIILWPDIFGLRKTKKDMARRLAAQGYAVLAVNPYYRSIKAPVIPDGEELRTEANWPKVREQAQRLTAQTNIADAKSFVAFLDATKAVNRKRKIGTMGYCMGGAMVLRAAAAVPERVGAGATFHGSRHLSNKPDSAHLMIPQMKAQFLIALAENDDQQDPAEKETLKEAFAAAKLSAEIEVYKGAMHGWCPPDGKAYNHEQAERAWGRMLELFAKAT